MGSIIIAIIILLFVAGILYGIYCMAGKAVNGVPLALVGIGCLLILLLVGLWLFGVVGSSPLNIKRVQSKPIGMHYYVVQHAYKPMKPGDVCALVYRKS